MRIGPGGKFRLTGAEIFIGGQRGYGDDRLFQRGFQNAGSRPIAFPVEFDMGPKAALGVERHVIRNAPERLKFAFQRRKFRPVRGGEKPERSDERIVPPGLRREHERKINCRASRKERFPAKNRKMALESAQSLGHAQEQEDGCHVVVMAAEVEHVVLRRGNEHHGQRGQRAGGREQGAASAKGQKGRIDAEHAQYCGLFVQVGERHELAAEEIAVSRIGNSAHHGQPYLRRAEKPDAREQAQTNPQPALPHEKPCVHAESKHLRCRALLPETDDEGAGHGRARSPFEQKQTAKGQKWRDKKGEMGLARPGRKKGAESKKDQQQRKGCPEPGIFRQRLAGGLSLSLSLL